MIIIKRRINQITSFIVNSFISENILYKKGNFNDIYFAYIDPQKVKFSHIKEKSDYNLGKKAKTGEYRGLWNELHYDFKYTLSFNLAKEVIQGKKGKTFRYLERRTSKENAEREWRVYNELRKTLEDEGYKSQYELGRVSVKLKVGQYLLPKSETYVGLNKKGDYIRLFSGSHRINLIRQIDHIKEIPVIITIHHPEAKKFLPKKSRIITGDDEDFRPFE